MKHLLLLVAGLVLLLPAMAQTTIAGTWTTIDDDTGQPRAYVTIAKASDGLYYGTLIEQLDADADPDATCTLCDEDDPRYGQRIVGIQIITAMEANADATEAENGKILDPENGSVYGCELTVLENGAQLQVRGFLGFSWLGRNQTWIRK